MAEVIRMPRLSDTMEEGTLVKWHKQEGDAVSMGDVIAEIETDKATMDFESPEDGTLLHIGLKEGESVPVNEIIAIVGEKGDDYKTLLEQASKKAGQSEDKEKAQATAPEKEETDKAETHPSRHPDPVSPGASSEETTDGHIKASPLAKRLAREKGIDLRHVDGSGDGGRIVKRDIETAEEAGGAQPFVPAAAGEEGYEDKPLSQMRKTIAKRLAESKYTAPHYYLTQDIRMDATMKARERINEMSPVKVSFNDIIVKAAAVALRRHPKVNVSWLGDKIRQYKHVHVGVAVAVDEGLLVPVVRFADTKSLAMIAQETKQYAERAKKRELEPSDWAGNTFSVSNLGMFGIEAFTAIINPPDSCILAVGRIKESLAMEHGEVRQVHVMRVTLSCDHRVVDGATGAQFLQTFRKLMEDPVRILI